MAADLKARPTEYKGVLYRSKSEALFARYLDITTILDGDKKAVWVYEPNLQNNLPGFACDFQRSWVVADGNEIVLRHQFIEYKPTIPTRAYTQEFFTKWELALEKSKSVQSKVVQQGHPAIFFGSVYCDASDRGMIYKQDSSVVVDKSDWLYGFESQLRSFRFDLEAY